MPDAPAQQHSLTTPDAAELVRRFETADPRHYGPVPIWWWSGAPLTRERLRWQMEQLLAQGVAQAVIINLAPTGPLYGSLADDPPFMSEAWWQIFLGACEDADELGFSFWPYDQIGFSGANLQGRLITQHPEWAGQALGRSQVVAGAGRTRIEAPLGAVPLAAYLIAHGGGSSLAVPVDGSGATVADGAGGTLSLIYSQTRGFDYLNGDATAALIDTVHGEFERRAGRWFGTAIAGFFQDELPAMPTWSTEFAATFESRNGFELAGRLAALWNDPLPTGADDASPGEVRRLFHDHRAYLATVATFDPLAAWFDDHGLICGFDQQSPAREGDPVGATALYGNYLDVHSGYGAPGSDHWGDSKVHSSLAHAGGHPRTWIESFHSSGWGGTLEETYDWLAPFLRRGATLYNPHAVYYSTVGGWWEWAPPSTCWRQPYWGQYHVLSHSVARLSQMLTTGDHVADTVLVFPTSTVQSGVTLDGALAEADEASAMYHALNGTPAWYAERLGVLDTSGHDYDIFDETVLAKAVVERGRLVVGSERYRNVVVPAASVLRDDVAAVLLRFADAGGCVVFAGRMPGATVGGASVGTAAVTETLTALVDRVAVGTVAFAPTAVAVAPLLVHDDVWVEADVPLLLRRIGDTWVAALFAHDGTSGTDQPIIRGGGSGIEWIETTWDAYWSEITEKGYEFRPVTGRVASVTLHGLDGREVQSWDPRGGARQGLGTPAEGRPFEIEFVNGTVALLVIGDDLPPAAHSLLEPPHERIAVDDWTVHARSSLDNRHGDFADARRTGTLPIEVWQFEHTELGPDGLPLGGESQTVTATFGPFADVIGPLAAEPGRAAEPGETARQAGPWRLTLDPSLWQPVSWSLSRGIEQDPVHGDSLGPKGYVPEEFLAWEDVAEGQWVAVRTSLTVPATAATVDPATAPVLAVGANAAKVAVIDGVVVALAGEGYLATTPLSAGRHDVTIWLQAERTERIRASFAVVTDLAHFRRPEWLEPVERSGEPTTWVVSHEFEVGELAPDARILVGSERPCIVTLNGDEIGRQSDFDPYADRRFGRLHPYDLASRLRPGRNILSLASLEGGRRPAVLVDSLPSDVGGLGIATGSGEWASSRDGRAAEFRLRSQQWQDPRFVCLEPKPHPLPRAHWLEAAAYAHDAVLDIVPDRDPASRATQVLRFDVPVGATAVTVPTSLAFFALRGDERLEPVDGRLDLGRPAASGTALSLVFEPSGGRRAGAVLDAAVEVETGTVAAELADWLDLGLAAAAGEVEYVATVVRPAMTAGERVMLDLGRVRGSAEVELDGRHLGHLAWSPYRLDITEAVSAVAEGASITVTMRVHNTLAGYLDHASPTPGVFAGQRSAGLFGPVALTRHRAD